MHRSLNITKSGILIFRDMVMLLNDIQRDEAYTLKTLKCGTARIRAENMWKCS